MKNYEGYINHLKSSCDYWKRIALAEREKKIYGLEKEEK